jgi:phenylacetate-coenzyme A ligase PaaK-like adenylate-forming protein
VEQPERPFFDPTPEGVQAFIAASPRWAADDDPCFWSKDRLDARRNELLQRQIEWLAVGSAHYGAKFAEIGLAPGDVRTTEDLRRLPVTTKQDLMLSPESFRLQLPDRDLYDMTYATVYTTGTTAGVPTRYEYTSHDYFGVLIAGRRMFKMQCSVPGDVLYAAFPLSPVPHVSGFGGPFAHAAGIGYYHAFAGEPHHEFPVQQSSAVVVDEVERLRPTILGGIGSFLRRLFLDAATDGRDLSSITQVMASGEVLTRRMLDDMRDNLERCGAKRPLICASYGFTEGAFPFPQCYDSGPLQNSAPDQIFIEVLDPETHERLPDGEVGLVAITHLNRRGMPLLRYLLGDRGAVTNARCERTGRIGQAMLVSAGSAHIQRTGDIVKIKGTLVNPAVIHDLVMNTPGIVEYQAVVSRKDADDDLSPDRFVIKMALEPTAQVDTADFARRVKGATEVTPEVEVVADPSQIYDHMRELKAKRLLDLR